MPQNPSSGSGELEPLEFSLYLISGPHPQNRGEYVFFSGGGRRRLFWRGGRKQGLYFLVNPTPPAAPVWADTLSLSLGCVSPYDQLCGLGRHPTGVKHTHLVCGTLEAFREAVEKGP